VFLVCANEAAPFFCSRRQRATALRVSGFSFIGRKERFLPFGRALFGGALKKENKYKKF
jgi:hypothetical protein